MNRLSLPLLFACTLTMVVAHSRGSAQTTTGAYHKVRANDSNVVLAARYAVGRVQRAGGDGEVVFERVIAAEAQVVAGTNYRIVVAVKQGGRLRRAVTVVFKGLEEGEMGMTSWRWIKRR